MKSQYSLTSLVCVMVAAVGAFANIELQTLADPAIAVRVEKCRQRLAAGNDDPYRWLALLARIDLVAGDGVPLYEELLADPRLPVRRFAIERLAGYGKDAETASDGILMVFDDTVTFADLQALAADTLATVAPNHPAVIHSFIDRLHDADDPLLVLQSVIRGLAAAGPDASQALSALVPFLNHADSAIQHESYVAIGRIQVSSSVSLEHLKELSEADLMSASGYGAFMALQSTGGRAGPVVPLLVRLVQKEDAPTYVKTMSLMTLGEIGMGDATAVAAVLAAVAADDPFISKTATEVCSRFDGGNEGIIDVMADGLCHPDACVRHQAALALAKSGAGAVPATPAVCRALTECDQHTDPYLIAAYLDVLRAMGSAGADGAETVVGLLPYGARLFTDRDKLEVIRLRAYLLVTLADIGVPRSGLPFIIDALANIDSRGITCEIGAAARAAGSYGPAGRLFTPYLISALSENYWRREFSLERYDSEYPPEEATSARLETIRALGRIRPPGDEAVISMLTRYANAGAGDPGDISVLAVAARQALANIGERHTAQRAAAQK